MADMSAAEMNRRDFVVATAVAGVGLAVLGSESLQAQGQPAGSATKIDIGTIADYPSDGVSSKFAKKPSGAIMVAREGDRIYAFTSICTHRQCVVEVKGDNLACPCHKSTFGKDGKVLSGQAKASLFRHAISKNDAGRLIVDKNKQFGEKQWEDEGAYVKVT
jgi:cytochrome b6-f complex iron-sulfur subunit